MKNGDDPETPRKLLKFDSSIDFDCLLRKIATKLGCGDEFGDVTPSDFYELSLGDGDAVVEDTSDLDHGDSLVLRRKATVPPPAQGSSPADDADVSNDDSSSSPGKRKSEVYTEESANNTSKTTLPDATNGGGNVEAKGGEETRESKKIKREDAVNSSEQDSKAGENASEKANNTDFDNSSDGSDAAKVKGECDESGNRTQDEEDSVEEVKKPRARLYQ